MSIEPLGPGEVEEARRLLEANALPVSDLTRAVQLLGERRSGSLIGVIGLESCGSVGLLRSLAVSEASRGSGLGSQLVDRLERDALNQGISALYLLTTTAERFFTRRGYTRVARDSAPPEIQATTEFATICPASSAVMRKVLSE